MQTPEKPDEIILQNIQKENELRNTLANERTLLAAERTFLSWIRTGLTSLGLGVAITRFMQFERVEHEYVANLVGEILMLWGMGIFGFALYSYRRTCQKLGAAVTQGSVFGITIVTVILIIMCGVLFWLVME